MIHSVSLTISKDRLERVINEVLDAWEADDFCFDLAKVLVERIDDASRQIGTVSLRDESEPPKNGPYR